MREITKKMNRPLTISAVRSWCTFWKKIVHQNCKNWATCSEPGGVWTWPDVESKLCSQGFVAPIKCRILAFFPNLQGEDED